jgi:hypothetical protein
VDHRTVHTGVLEREIFKRMNAEIRAGTAGLRSWIRVLAKSRDLQPLNQPRVRLHEKAIAVATANLARLGLSPDRDTGHDLKTICRPGNRWQGTGPDSCQQLI